MRKAEAMAPRAIQIEVSVQLDRVPISLADPFYWRW